MQYTLNLWSNEAEDVLTAVARDFTSCGRGRARNTVVSRSADGAVVITNSNWRFKTEAFAWALKDIISWRTSGMVTGTNFKEHLDEEIVIKHKSPVDYTEIFTTKTTVRFLRCLYEIILNRDDKKIIQKYGEEVFRRAKGMPADPFVTMKREQLMKQKNELTEEEKKMTNDFYAQRDKELDVIYKKYRELIRQKSAEFRIKQSEIDGALLALKTNDMI